MTRLVSYQITNLAQANMVTPFDPAMVNPASLTVRLSDIFGLLIERAGNPEMVRYSLHGHDEDNPYLLVPGQLVAARLLERFSLPPTIEAQMPFMIWENGLQVGTTVYPPGSGTGYWKVVIKNNSQLHPIPLWPGMCIGKVFFTELARSRGYSVNASLSTAGFLADDKKSHNPKHDPSRPCQRQ
jgi:deoxycytidine triphosphate deaminase